MALRLVPCERAGDLGSRPVGIGVEVDYLSARDLGHSYFARVGVAAGHGDVAVDEAHQVGLDPPVRPADAGHHRRGADIKALVRAERLIYAEVELARLELYLELLAGLFDLRL